MMSYNNSTKKQLDIINPDYEHNQFNWKTYNNYRLLSSTFSKLVTHNKCADDESEFCYKLYLNHSVFNEEFKLFMDSLKNKNITKYNSYIHFVYYSKRDDCVNNHSYINNDVGDYNGDRYSYKDDNEEEDHYNDFHNSYYFDDHDDSNLYPTPDGMGTDDWDDYLEQNNID